MYAQKKITLTGAQTDTAIRALAPELWAARPDAADYLAEVLIAADVDFSIKLNSTAGDAFPVKALSFGQVFQEEKGNIKNIYITSLGTVNLNFLSRVNP